MIVCMNSIHDDQNSKSEKSLRNCGDLSEQAWQSKSNFSTIQRQDRGGFWKIQWNCKVKWTAELIVST